MEIIQKPKSLASHFKKSSTSWRKLCYWQEEENKQEKEEDKYFESVIYAIITDVDTR